MKTYRKPIHQEDNIAAKRAEIKLAVGEMIKQALGMIFIREEAKISNLETREITVTEVRMSQDLKIAKAFVLPLGGKNSQEIVEKLKEFSFIIRKVLSKKITMKQTKRTHNIWALSFLHECPNSPI